MPKEKKKPTLLQALSPLIALALLLSIGYGVFCFHASSAASLVA